MHRIASTAVGAALLALAVSLTTLLASPRALAGDGGTAPAAAPPAAAAAPEPSLRQTAVDVAIRQLERHLAGLRKTRSELRAGHPEPVLADDDRRQHDLDTRAMREVARYEAARSKAV